MRHVKNAFLLEGENNSKIAFLEGAIENTGLSTESPDTFKVPSGTQMHLSPYFQQLYVTVADESIKDQNWYIWRDNQSVCQADGDLWMLIQKNFGKVMEEKNSIQILKEDNKKNL